MAKSNQKFALETPSSPPPSKRKSAFETPSPPSKKKFALETPSPPPLRRPVRQLFFGSVEEVAETEKSIKEFQARIEEMTKSKHKFAPETPSTPPSKQKFSLQTPSPPPLRRSPVSPFFSLGSMVEEAAAFKELCDELQKEEAKSKQKFFPETPSTPLWSRPVSQLCVGSVEEVAANKEKFEQLQAEAKSKPTKGWD